MRNAKPRKSALLPDDVLKIRKLTGLNQAYFWNRLGVTQSGGSRYESGRKMPVPVQILFNLVYQTTASKSIEALNKLREREVPIPEVRNDRQPDSQSK